VNSGVGHNETALWIGLCDGGDDLARMMYDSQPFPMHQSQFFMIQFTSHCLTLKAFELSGELKGG
jgi:hypothetical protein